MTVRIRHWRDLCCPVLSFHPVRRSCTKCVRLIFKSVSRHTAMYAALTAEGRSLQEGKRMSYCCRVTLPCRLACRAESHSRTHRGRLRALAVHAHAAGTVQLELGFGLSKHGVIRVLPACKESAHECYLLCSLWGPKSESMAIMFEALLGTASHTACCWPCCAAEMHRRIQHGLRSLPAVTLSQETARPFRVTAPTFSATAIMTPGSSAHRQLARRRTSQSSIRTSVLLL